MKVILQIERGYRKDVGNEFVCGSEEADNITVGRSAQGSEEKGGDAPHIRISAADPRLSRWHFMLQLRPPNCYVLDTSSENHTYVDRFGAGEHITGPVLVHDGALIRAGGTYIRVRIEAGDAPPEASDDCAVCGRRIADQLTRYFDEIGSELFVCDECKRERRASDSKRGWPAVSDEAEDEGAAAASESDRRDEPEADEAPAEHSIVCGECGQPWSERADADGRAGELADVATYICDDCLGRLPETGVRLGQYRVLARAGSGGRGIVHVARHDATGRVAAVKQLHTTFRKDRRALKLFHREISVAHTLVHPNIVRFYESFTVDGAPCLATEYLSGGDAHDMLEQLGRPLEYGDAVRVMLQVLDGLHLAHGRGIVHRDLKPRNVLFDAGGVAKLADMGLAKSFEKAGDSGYTMPGTVGGSVLFMAPEQFHDFRGVKPPADVYSAGVCLYYMMTRLYPYDYPSDFEAQNALGRRGLGRRRDPYEVVRSDTPIPLRDRVPEAPEALGQAIERCLRKDPDARYADAQELSRSLRDAVHP